MSEISLRIKKIIIFLEKMIAGRVGYAAKTTTVPATYI